MLTTLNLKDFVIVDQLSLDLSSGFTVLTGETGAGKSILIDAIQLIRGGRGDADLVRQGCERANIIAEFSLGDASRHWLEENDLLETGAGSVLVRRAIDRNGRSRAWINGISVTLSQLRELGDTHADIQGQHAHQQRQGLIFVLPGLSSSIGSLRIWALFRPKKANGKNSIRSIRGSHMPFPLQKGLMRRLNG